MDKGIAKALEALAKAVENNESVAKVVVTITVKAKPDKG